MRIKSVSIENFKAINKTTIDLADFTVLVGTNGSGKSSVLQALHWMFQSGRNRSISTNKKITDGATLSEKDATFMPSPDYRSSGHGTDYGNFQGAPKLNIDLVAETNNGDPVNAKMWIKAARNEGISVHVPSGNQFVTTMRDQSREFSAYIPGISGIPLSEEKRSKLIVQRLAAAGDANTVLRNVLDLLKQSKINNEEGLQTVERYVSRIMGDFTLEVDFEDDKHTTIQARFQTKEMREKDPKRFKPLELAGIGFLQITQIFAYLVYFRPALLLVDEPDAHLHPTAQEKLVSVLSEAAIQYGTQVLLSTHSPSVVKSLPSSAQVIWMKGGEVQPEGNTKARNLMGWGLLDRRVLLMTEDSGVGVLKSFLSQWPDLERVTAIWPIHGTGKLPPPETIKGLQALFGGDLKIVIHRDRDFMMPQETDALAQPYLNNDCHIWFTANSDIEAYLATSEVIMAHFDISLEDAEAILSVAVLYAEENNAALVLRRKKRNDALQKIAEAKKGQLPHPSDYEVEQEATKHGYQHKVMGKDLISQIRKAAKDLGYQNSGSFGKSLPNLQTKIATDLQNILNSACS